MRKVILPSGAEMTVNMAPFTEANELFRSVAKGFLDTKITKDTLVSELQKNIFTACVVSPTVESALWKCLGRCLVGELKIDHSTFEKEESREDYLPACVEVAKENLYPFLKSLPPELKTILLLADVPFPGSESLKTTSSSFSDSSKEGTPQA